MIQMIRLCPDCGWDRRFQQHHTGAGSCPDSPAGDCPEWGCTGCGSALLIGVLPIRPDLAVAGAAGLRRIPERLVA
jgi:hypothetical protein